MFSMSIQQNFRFGCGPFMPVFNPRMNFFMGMAAATMQPIPMLPAINYSFNPNMAMNFTNPLAMGGFGTFNYQAPVFNYMPQPLLPQMTMPQFTFPNFATMGPFPFASSSAKPSATTSSSSDAASSDSEVRPQGITLKGKGKGTQYGPQFLDKVKQIANNLNCNYRDLLAIMNSESGIDAKTVGSNGASGLICFMPQYYDVASIRKMSPMQQLDLVEKAFKEAKVRFGFGANAKLSKGDLYALIFLPSRAKREVLCTKGEVGKNGKLLNYYESNAALDANKDGKITKSEMATRINKKYVTDNTFLA